MGTRYIELTNANWPEQTTNPGAMLGLRHFGDGTAGRIITARLQGYSTADLAYFDLAVNGSGYMLSSTAPAASAFHSTDLDETEEAVKATAGTIHGIWVTNTATATRWVKIFDNTVAGTIVGTTVPTAVFGIPGNANDDVAGSLPIPPGGLSCSTGITIAATTGQADNDVGAPGANDVVVTVFYT